MTADPEPARPAQPGTFPDPGRGRADGSDLSPPEPPILVSACLAGLRTRHDGGSRPDPRIVELVASGRAIPVCPEQLGGLPTPREPANLTAGPGCRAITASGADVTENFRRGAEETLRIARLTGARRAILKERSPSCGTCRVWQFDPESGEPRLVEGSGVTAGALAEAGLELSSEETYPAATGR